MERRRYFGFDRNIFYTGLNSFFTDTSTKMIYSVMPLFLMSIGASKTQISLIEGIAESTASIMKALSGFWSDKIGKNKPFMIIGYATTALITPLYAFVINPIQVLVLRFIERLGKGVRTAPRDSLISASIKKNETGKSFGFHKMMDNSGAILGPLLASSILFFRPGDFKTIFILAAIPAIIGVFIIIFLIKEKKKQEKVTRSKVAFKHLPKNYYIFLFIIGVFTLGNSTDSLMLIRLSETGINESFVPLIYMIFNTVSVLLAVQIGKLSDKIGRVKLIILGFLIYSFVYLMFGAFNNITVFILMFVLYGVYSALTDTCQKALVSDLVNKEMKGTGFGLYHAVLGIMLLPASAIGGYLYDNVSPSATFYFGSSLSLIAAIMMILFMVKLKNDKSKSMENETV
ncbi:MAG: MFS transporter [Dysgonamonadaceae bacterium]|nr:MFS transporter [Dysgonamonadaceae bacterium]MDD3308332.1 MFS transporter [Dysgonamonadaceae bacterium]MDD3900285.1 MFS transporter [Dysgonamonadaceae bacterium]MDD4398841.1 MFS transporter [Dysgonamonadaceae bacterium]